MQAAGEEGQDSRNAGKSLNLCTENRLRACDFDSNLESDSDFITLYLNPLQLNRARGGCTTTATTKPFTQHTRAVFTSATK